MRSIPSLLVVGVLVAGCAAPSGGSLEAEPATTSTTTVVGDVAEPVEGTSTTVPSADPTTTTREEEEMGEDADDRTPKVVGTSPTSELEAAPPPSGVVEAGLAPLVEQAKADLAARLGIAVDEITVVSAEAVVWPDGSLGCPQPGMAYTQVLVEGAKIVLWAEGRTWPYHAGGERSPFLCDQK